MDLGVLDASSKLYKDKSGAKLGGGVSEGRANFGHITNEAIRSVEVFEAEQAAEKAKAEA